MSLGDVGRDKQVKDEFTVEEICNQLLDSLKFLRNDGKSRSDMVVKENEEKLRQALKIPDDIWIKSCKGLSLEGLIDNFSGQLNEMMDFTFAKDELSPNELLQQVSDGLALKGILVTNEARECANVRETIIEVPSGVSLKCPMSSQSYHGLEHTSQVQAEDFHKSFCTLGHSISMSRDNLFSFQTEAGMLQSETDKQMDSETAGCKSYLSKVKYCYIPMASCEFEKKDLMLCREALKDLKGLEQQIEGSGDEAIKQKLSESFLRKYGSHVNLSVEFGGVYTCQATYCSEVSFDKENVDNILNDALAGLTAMSYSGIGITHGGSMSGNQVKAEADVAISHNDTELSKLTLNVTTTGGLQEVTCFPLQEVTCFPLWRLGLFKSNTTWAVIDRGSSFNKDFLGIWELVESSPTKFSDARKLAETLQRTWKLMTDLPPDPPLCKEATVSLTDFIENIDQEWSTINDFSTNAIGYLHELIDRVEQCCSGPDGIEVWVRQLNTNKVLYSFLKHVMRIKEEYLPTELPDIYYYLNKILKLAQGHDFPLRNEINEFIIVEGGEYIPDIMKQHMIQNITSLTCAIKETLLSAMEADHAKANCPDEGDTRTVQGDVTVDLVDEIDIQATKDIEIALGHLELHLQKSNKCYELFLLQVALREISFDYENGCFSIPLTEQSIAEFTQRLENLWEEYLTYKEAGDMEIQAFLIQLLISSLPEDSKDREQHFEDSLRAIQKLLTSDIAMTLARFTSSLPYYWNCILGALDGLKKGDKSILQNRAVDIFSLEEISIPKPHSYQSFCSPVRVSPIPLDSSNAGKLLLQLGLMNQFPSKISLQDVMTIGNLIGNEYETLPWRILQKLIMLDYNARDCKPRKATSNEDDTLSETSDTKDDCGFDSFLEDFTSEDADEVSLNPLDVFLTIYSCCDMVLKQVLLQKMVQCRLAVPFISPQLSDGHLLYSLWSLRNIIVEWKNKDQVCMETSIVNQPIIMVSFLRLGKPCCSKSLLLNNVISDQAHHTFWNRECPLGNTDRYLADGLVEAQWYIPAGKATDIFEDVTMFLNLRGDVCKYENQLEFLETISNVVVCCLETTDLGKPHILKTMREIHGTSTKVILLLTAREPGLMDQSMLRNLSEQYIRSIGKANMANTKIISGIKGNRIRTTEDLKQELRSIINKFVSGQSGKSINDSKAEAKLAGFEIDENEEICKKAKLLAQCVTSCMMDKSTNECRKEMLPLQGEDWQEWSKLLKNKQQSKGNCAMVDSIHEKAQIQVSMTQIRQKQLEVCNNLSDLMKTFLRNLLEVIDSPTVLLYLQWLKIYLDKRSRNTLPGLHREYHKKWLEFHSSVTDAASATLLKKQLEASEKLVAEASLGMEHLLREVTQIYEAAYESKLELSQPSREIIDQLPRVAAKLLLKGQPIEIMDGDTANVPLTWIKAVFSSLMELVGNKKLFVISVLGIQSSGKSTLLNTMFGLQFAVSAGRCTRGVYMQLIKVDKERSDLPYDYVLVIDTEGLRAPELGRLKHDNDNQLATFVIGLGDVTILNIKGENVAEVSDVLQIAVHAFLRMKIVNKNFRLHRTCVFIHQNVPAVNAKEKMQRGCQKLKEGLDEMTREASAIENIVDIQTFNDVIEFDGETNVWYFSDLWHGDPPMAPANPGYSAKVQEVKDHLLNELAQKQEGFLSFLDMKLRVEDLWKGVLSENFVFSFRNSLAAKAYNNLESIYHEKSWDIENSINKWITQDALVQLERCSTEDDLDASCLDLLTKLYTIGGTLRDSALSDLEQFFETHNLKDILIEWQTTKTESLKNDTRLFLQRAEREIRQKKDSLRVDLVQKASLVELSIEIMTKAKNLADEMKGQKAADNDLQQIFERFWIERENEYANRSTIVLVPIERTVEHLLYKRLEKDSAALQQELRQNPLSRPAGSSVIITGRDIQCSHISVRTSISERFLSYVPFINRPSRWHQYKQAAADISNNILKHVCTYLTDVSQQESGFQELYATNVIKRVVDGVYEHNSKTEQTFTLLPNLKVKIAVHASRYAVAVFKRMQREYEETYAIERKLEAFKQTAWNLFKNTVNQCTIEVIAADLLANHLEILVKKAVKDRMSGEIVNHVVRYFNQRKFHLIVRILTDLTEGPFDDYMAFISNSRDFTLNWITSFTNKEIFPSVECKMSKYLCFAEEHSRKLAESIRTCIRATTENLCKQTRQGASMKLWVKTFCRTLRELPIKEEDLKPMMEQNVENFENLQKLLIEKVMRLVEHVMATFTSDSAESIKWEGKTPYKQILDRLWGCKAQCPFCREVCQRTDPNHLSPNDCHQCIQHRPGGVSGRHWETDDERNGKITLAMCSFKVQSNICFKRNDQWHPYREYKAHEPDWDIAPSPHMESSKYWLWFMATYKQQLSCWYRLNVPDIPEAWHQISKQEAVDSLRVYTN